MKLLDGPFTDVGVPIIKSGVNYGTFAPSFTPLANFLHHLPHHIAFA